MGIVFGSFLHASSFMFSIFQLLYVISLIVLSHLRKRRASLNAERALVISGLVFSLVLFSLLSALNASASYSGGGARYKITRDPSTTERVMQVSEILLDSAQVGTLFLTASLFLPTFRVLNVVFGDAPYSEAFARFLLVMAAARVFLYPSLYGALIHSPVVGLYVVDVLCVADLLILMYVFASIYVAYDGITHGNHVLNIYRRMVFDSVVKDFKRVLICVFAQIFITGLYKVASIFVAASGFGVASAIVLDYSYLSRLAVTALQSHCVLKMCFSREMWYFENNFQCAGQNQKGSAKYNSL